MCENNIKMKLSEVKKHLQKLDELVFLLPNGNAVPKHFHVTEVGQIQKHFIDCGGVVRQETTVNFQLWTAKDYDHRLQAQKLLEIIALSEKTLLLEDREVEVEYQADTIGKFGLDFNGKNFILTTKLTDCLAPDKCGIPAEKPKIKLSELKSKPTDCCTPSSGCC